MRSPLLFAVLIACGSGPIDEKPADWPTCGDDCEESCDDGIDNDGDYLIDCMDPLDCRATCDADDDGYTSEALGGPDCDDSDPATHPSATELPYDGTDNDCDPLTPDDDVDGDGFDLATDCDDSLATAYPGAPEVCGNGVIDDCDATGTVPRSACYGDRPLSTADAKLIGANTDDRTGYALSGAGDVDGDGFADLLIGAYGEGSNNTGAAYVVRGPVSGDLDLSTATAKLIGESEDDWAGHAVGSARNLFGNGQSFLLIGAQYDDGTGHNAGAVYVVPGTATGDIPLADAVARLLGATDHDRAGYSLTAMGDTDGDGFGDLLIGAIQADAGGNDAGAAYLVRGPLAPVMELGFAAVVIDGKSTNDNTGCAVADAGDITGTGLHAALIGGCSDDGSGLNAGAAYLFTDWTPASLTTADAVGILQGAGADDAAGTALAGGTDLDGDGTDDVAVGAPYSDANGADAGAVYLAHGPDLVDLIAPIATIHGAVVGDNLGISLTFPGDLNGDGAGDVVAGASANDAAGEDAGAVYVYFGPVYGNRIATDADVLLTGEAPFDFAGQALASPGDVDGDGFPDLLLGAPFNDHLAPAAGATYLMSFGY